MALIKCEECGHEVSDKASACPKCGCPTGSQSNGSNVNSKNSGRKWITIILAVIAFISIVAISFYALKEKTESVKKTEMFNTETLSSDDFVGKVYQGSGNGRGLGIDMVLRFIEDGKCEGNSDWYRAYGQMTTCMGTYKILDGRLLVEFHLDDVDYKFDFDISDDGRTISFDHSDSSIRGSIGNDFLSLSMIDKK